MRIGLIGYGAWGKQHAAAIVRLPGLELAAVTAATEASREEARAAHPQAAILDNYNELLNWPDVEMADIVLPNYLHVEVAEAALMAGKHVLLEKPMATSKWPSIFFVKKVRKLLLSVPIAKLPKVTKFRIESMIANVRITRCPFIQRAPSMNCCQNPLRGASGTNEASMCMGRRQHEVSSVWTR